jgi:hypothetical protein
MRTLALAVAACSAFLPAQQNIIWHDDVTPTTGAANAFPFGAQGVRTQQLIPQSVLGSNPAVIQDLFVNPQVHNSYTQSQVHYGDFEIRMGITQLTTLTNTWATNSPNPTTVYRGPLLVKFVRDQWVPLGLPASYLWLPTTPADNLVIDFICWNVIDAGAVPWSGSGYFMNSRSSPTQSISRAYRLNWTSTQPATSAGVDGYGIKLGFLLNDGNFIAHDGRCAGSSGQVPSIGTAPGAWPQIGQTFPVDLANGPVNSFATLVLGIETVNYLGVPLPLDLTVVGAPNCRFWHGWEVLLPIVPTDAAGSATFPLAIPPGPWNQLRFRATWLGLDLPANAFGLVPSGFGTLIL